MGQPSLAAFSEPRLVVIFDRLGPYHVARLDAVGRQARVVALEIAELSSEYAWSKVGKAENFARQTFFAGKTSQAVSAAQLRQKMWLALDQTRPDLVALPGWSDRAALAGLEWCVRAGVPVVVMSESTALDAKRWPLREAAKSRIVSLMGAGLAGGRSAAEYLATLGLPRDRIFVGYDVVDNSHFAHRAEVARGNADAIRKQLSLPQSYFLACSRFVPKKNLSGLITAFARYHADSGPAAWKLVLVGDGELKPRLLAQSRELGVADAVIFAGFVDYDNLPSYYGLANAFVHPSTVEQWGLVVNEAMAAGLPVLVSERCGCAPDLVENGVNGFTFDPNDTVGLAVLMGNLSAACNIEQMGSASTRIVSRWTPEFFAENLLEAAAAAIDAGPPHPRLIDSILLAMLRPQMTRQLFH